MRRPKFPKMPFPIHADELEEDSLSRIEELSSELNIVFEPDSCEDIIYYLSNLYETEKNGKQRKRILGEIETLAKTAYGHLSHARLNAAMAGERTTRFPSSVLHDRSTMPSISSHETKQAMSAARKLLQESLGFWRVIENHFSQKPIVSLITSLLDGTCDEKITGRVLETILKLPQGISQEDLRRQIELELLSIAFKSDAMRSSQPTTVYDLICSAKSGTNFQLQAYAFIKKFASSDYVESGFLCEVNFSQFNKTDMEDIARLSLLFSLATNQDSWCSALTSIFRLPHKQAEAVVSDLACFARGESPSNVVNSMVHGGKDSVLRLDVSIDSEVHTLFFRFGDARSHALGYDLLSMVGLPVPAGYEFSDSLCFLEKKVDGKDYQSTPSIPKSTANSLGRLVAACFVFGIPDPNPTNFIVRGKGDVVKIDAESAPNGWNYYSEKFLGGLSTSRPNDSLAFARLLNLKSGISNEIRRGFLEEIAILKKHFSNPKSIDELCDYVATNYLGAYIYRSSGFGISQETITRLSSRLVAILSLSPENVLQRAESGVDLKT